MTVKTYKLKFRLRTTADRAKVWQLMRDTDTFNRVAQMGFRFTEQVQADGSVKRIGKVSRFGLKIPWIEKPYEYEHGSWWSTERVFMSGPVDRYEVVMRLSDDGDGTLIDYQVEFWPRNSMLLPVVKLDATKLVKPKLEGTLKRAVKFLNGDITRFELDPPRLNKKIADRLAKRLDQLTSPRVASRLGRFIADAPLQLQNMMHPLKLAKRWNVPSDELIRGCFEAVDAGILTMHWQLMCPSCRMPKEEDDHLTLERGKAHCVSCNVRYDGSFPDSIAVSFRPDPSIRKIDMRIECLGSPGRTPSIVAQTHIGAGESRSWTARLLPGCYRVRTWPRLEVASLQVRRDIDERAMTLALGPRAIQPPLLRLAPGEVHISVRNRLDEPVRLAIQRRDLDDRVLTAGRLFEVADVQSWLPDGVVSAHLRVATGRRAVIAVSVQRGGRDSRKDAADALRAYRPAELYLGDDMVIACFMDAGVALSATEAFDGAQHLGTSVALGAVTMLHEGDLRIPSGRVVEKATALARAADGGVILLPESGTSAEIDAAIESASDLGVFNRRDGRRCLDHTDPKTPPLRVRVDRRKLQRGDVVDGRFEVAERVGIGGFGAVFAAHDKRTRTDVVVKVLNPHMADDPVQVQRFFNEGRITAGLNSDFIARTIDFGLGMDGRLYIAMERLHGCELHDLIKEAGKLDPDRALRLCADALRGLEDAHTAGLVHRDIKPGNLFVCQDDDGERVKVIDFGIAIVSDPTARADHDTKTAIGTPHYMSPEQASASADIDHRSDIYSLGIVLYQCVSGAYPFAASTTMGLLIARLHDDPLPLGGLAHNLPEGFEEVVMRSLERPADKRYGTAGAMRSALERVRAREYVVQNPGRHGPRPAFKSAITRHGHRAPTGENEQHTLDMGE